MGVLVFRNGKLRMKIAHLISTLSYGGAERQLLALCRGFREAGHTVSVGTLKSGGELVETFKQHDFQVDQFHLQHALDASVVKRLKKWIASIQPNFVHTHLFKADVYGHLACSSLEVPHLCTKWNEDRYLKNPLISRIARWAAAGNFKVVAISKAVKTYLIQTCRLKEDQIQVIPLGISEIERHPILQENGAIRFGIVGRLVKQKGHEILFPAFKKLLSTGISTRLSVFGGGPLESRLKRLSRELGIERQVDFHGIILDTEAIYEQIHVLVLPSLWEGGGLVLLEAMSRGIPVIGTRAGGIIEYAGENLALLVQPGDGEELAAAMLKIAKDRQLRARLSENSLRAVRGFCLSKSVDAYLKLYGELAGILRK